MKCPRCNIEMKKGVAIAHGYNENERGPANYIPHFNAKTYKLIECSKCPNCGHSDDKRVDEK